MSKLFELSHWLWMEARLGLPPSLQRVFLPALHQAKEIARLITRPHLEFQQWQGHNEAGPLSVAYAGFGYAEPMLKSLLFAEHPLQEEIGKSPLWQLNKFIDSLTSDIVIVEAGEQLIQKLPRQHALVLPSRLQFILDVQGTWEDVENRFRRDARRNEVRKAQKFGYEYEISRSQADLEMFYHDMYLPMVHKRHGELASTLSKREVYQILRHGVLFLTRRDGIYVSGGLCLVEQGVLRFKEMGVLNGDEQLMHEGAVGAMNYLRVRWAHQEGYRGVNFGECWPYMSGIFQSKRKWGAAASVPPHEHKQIWLRIQRNTPAVAHFLENNPCVVVDEQGSLHGLIVTSNPVTTELEKNWHKLYDTPGFTHLLICSSGDLAEQPVVLRRPTTEAVLEH